MINPKAIVLILFALISCKSNITDLTGKYKSHKPIFFDKVESFLTNKRSWVSGNTLDLKKDSSFRLVNCSMEINGKWKQKGDSLLLYVTNKRFRIDSLNHNVKWKKYLIPKTETAIYIIKKDYLEALLENKSIVDRLKKTE